MSSKLTICVAIAALFAAAGTQLAYSKAPQGAAPDIISAALPDARLVMPTKVVELFTSQGCSSCPRSNAILTELDTEPDILGLTYSVEYWDYLGWKDTFADPDFSSRQRAYSEALGHGRVYTPQMVVNGALDKPRFSRAEIDDLDLLRSAPLITLNGSGQLEIGRYDGVSTANIRLVRYVPGVQSVAVKKGENGGRTLSLSNVVTEVTDLGRYDGRALVLAVPKASHPSAEARGFAVLLQAHDDGRILSAAHSQ